MISPWRGGGSCVCYSSTMSGPKTCLAASLVKQSLSGTDRTSSFTSSCFLANRPLPADSPEHTHTHQNGV